MIKNCPMRHENGNCIPAGGFCTANKNICEALLNAYRMGKAQLSKEGTTSDLISRTETVKQLQGVLDVTVPITDYDGGFIDGVEVGVSTVSTMPPAQPEVLACGNGELVAQPEPQWIPVSERLPEKGGEYLVSVHHTIGAISVFHPEKDTYVDDVAIMKYYGKFPSTVRAWMPLPEAYKPNK